MVLFGYTIDSALDKIGIRNSPTSLRSYKISALDFKLDELLGNLSASDLEEGIQIELILHDLEIPWRKVVEQGGDYFKGFSASWKDFAISCIRKLYGQKLNSDSGVRNYNAYPNERDYTLEEMFQINYDETLRNIFEHSEFGYPSKINLWATTKGFIVGLEQKGFTFDPRSKASQIQPASVFSEGNCGFRSYIDTCGYIFFDIPWMARSTYIMYLIQN